MTTTPRHGDDPGGSAVRRLAEALTALRSRSLTIDQFCTATDVSRARVTIVEGGLAVPTRGVFHAYLEACEPTAPERRELRALFDQARHEDSAQGEDATKIVELAEAMSIQGVSIQALSGPGPDGQGPDGEGVDGKGTAIIPVPLTVTSPDNYVGVDPPVRNDQGAGTAGSAGSAMQNLVVAKELHMHTHHHTTDMSVTNVNSVLEATVYSGSALRPAPSEQASVNLRLSKPAWVRSTVTSQADPRLWPDPDLLTTAAEFTKALSVIRESTALSYRALAAETQRLRFPLATSTVHGMCKKDKLPGDPQAVRFFIRACGGTEEDANRWIAARQRIAQAAVVRPSRPTQDAGSTDAGSTAIPAAGVVPDAEVVDQEQEVTTVTTTPAVSKPPRGPRGDGQHRLVTAAVANDKQGWAPAVILSMLALLVLMFGMGIVVGALAF